MSPRLNPGSKPGRGPASPPNRLGSALSFKTPEAAPVVTVAAMIVISLAWNDWVGISWYPGSAILLGVPVMLLALAGVYATIRPAPLIAEVCLYLALWALFPIFGTRLSYLCYAFGLPLADAALSNADAALGFSWVNWGVFVQSHPVLDLALQAGYQSYMWQPAVAIVASAIWRPRKRNAELFMALSVSLAITLIVTTFLPAVGPAESLGYNPAPGPIIKALRMTPTAQSLPYAGIISFPSFHTVMAVLFAYAHRGIRWTFPVAFALNVLMVLSVPLSGDHYLVDLLSGVVVALIGILTARRLLPVIISGRLSGGR